MAWNEGCVSYLKKTLKEKRNKALEKGNHNGAMAFDIIDFLSENSETKYYGPDLVAKFNLKSMPSLGAHLKAQTKVMEYLGFNHEEIYGKNSHAWFVDWEYRDKSCYYWLSKEKSMIWKYY